MSRGSAEAATGGLRGLIGAAVLISAYVHLQLYADGMAQTPVIGPLFLLNAGGGLVIGLAVLFWRHWLPMLGALGFGVATLGAFLLSATVGLFGLHEQLGGLAQVAAGVTEIICIVGAAAWFVGAARAQDRADARRPTHRASA